MNAEWQPIETVPKTGERILVYDGYKISVVYYYNAEDNFVIVGSECSDMDDYSYIDAATHWMPLPHEPDEPAQKVCHWTRRGNMGATRYEPGCHMSGWWISDAADYKFCPYCGRRIEASK